MPSERHLGSSLIQDAAAQTVGANDTVARIVDAQTNAVVSIACGLR
jgi:hypothetical protein